MTHPALESSVYSERRRGSRPKMKSFGRKKRENEKQTRKKNTAMDVPIKSFITKEPKSVFFVLFFITVSLRVVFRTRLFYSRREEKREKKVSPSPRLFFYILGGAFI